MKRARRSRPDPQPRVAVGLAGRLENVGSELRDTLLPVLEAVAGTDSRPGQLTRAIGVDKSLASRLVRAVHAPGDLEFMHLVPSPAGLRILLDHAREHAPPAALAALRASTDRFQELIDATPGGRAALHSRISESSDVARTRRERIAKQASFKSMSYLLGYFSDVLSTTLLIVPSANERMVDGIEIHRRIGLHRIRPSAPLQLFGFLDESDETRTVDTSYLDTLGGTKRPIRGTDLLLPEFSSRPLPTMDVIQEAGVTTLMLPTEPELTELERVTWAYRQRNGGDRTLPPGLHSLGSQLLHMPCRKIVRDIYIAESVYPGATPLQSCFLPGPRSHPRWAEESIPRQYTSVDIDLPVESLGALGTVRRTPGLPDQADLIRHVLEQAGHGRTRFRGWRCAMTYPIPLAEMVWWLRVPA